MQFDISPATPPPPLTASMRCHLVRGLHATLRRDENSAHNPRRAGQPIGALLTRIAQTKATLAEIEGLR